MSETNRITVWVIGLLATVLPVTVILWAADAPFLFGLLIFTEQFLAFVLAMTLALVFLCVRIDRRSAGPVPWYDISASVLGFVSASYVAVVYPTLAMELAFTPVKSVVVATILLVLIVEAVRLVHDVVVNPGKRATGVLEPTNLVGYQYALVTHAGMDDDVVYKAVKALAENKKSLAKSHGIFNSFKPEKMVADLPGATYHPGAIKYYKEQGWWPQD